MLKLISLPRRARDKHTESTQKRVTRFLTGRPAAASRGRQRPLYPHSDYDIAPGLPRPPGMSQNVWAPQIRSGSLFFLSLVHQFANRKRQKSSEEERTRRIGSDETITIFYRSIKLSVSIGQVCAEWCRAKPRADKDEPPPSADLLAVAFDRGPLAILRVELPQVRRRNPIKNYHSPAAPPIKLSTDA